MRKFLGLGLASLVALAGCGEEAKKQPAPADECSTFSPCAIGECVDGQCVAGDVVEDIDPGVDTSVDTTPDTQPDTTDTGTTDTIEPTGSACGVACAADGDCDSGLCRPLGTGAAKVCTELFATDGCDGCPSFGPISAGASGTDGDLCAAGDYGDCAACTADADCGAGLCQPTSGSTFCQMPCFGDNSCPEGFTCRGADRNGTVVAVCEPDNGLCTGCVDDDGDGYGVGPSCLGPDCAPTNNAINPGAAELCNNADEDCDGRADDGISLATDENNCGGCGIVCDLANSDEACLAGICRVGSCSGNFADCDSDRVTGCEVNLDDPDTCGACVVTGGLVGAPCGICGDGVFACSGVGTAECVGDTANACGGCEPLPQVLGDTCGCGAGEWACDPATPGAQVCINDALANDCGGCGVVEGGVPGAACCGAFTLACDPSNLNSVFCDVPDTFPRNACGGCTALSREPAQPCGTCESGATVCDGREATRCDGDLGNAALNGCGGCATLPGEPGEACGTCGLNSYVCDATDIDQSSCNGDTRVNSCGGCAALDIAPGAACCETYTSVCDLARPGLTKCDVPVTVQLNACGGCGVLDQRLGEVCGTCGSGRYACGGQDTVVCAGDLGAAALNGCGGCGLLDGEPGSACGPCGEDFVECVGTDIVACDGATSFNSCGGCLPLANEPGATCCGGTSAYTCNPDDRNGTVCPSADGRVNFCGGCGNGRAELDGACGTCGSGTYACDRADPTAVVCNGDQGAAALNACGGCGPLSARIGEACGSCGLDTYICDPSGGGDVVCGGNTTFDCGGCTNFSASAGDACGSCGLGTFACSGSTLTCVGDAANECGTCETLLQPPGGSCCEGGTLECNRDTGTVLCNNTDPGLLNACGGCARLGANPGDGCGTCGYGTFICDGDGLTCEGDPGDGILNACGGCSALDGLPNESCGGGDIWVCDGTEAVFCSPPG